MSAEVVRVSPRCEKCDGDGALVLRMPCLDRVEHVYHYHQKCAPDQMSCAHSQRRLHLLLLALVVLGVALEGVAAHCIRADWPGLFVAGFLAGLCALVGAAYVATRPEASLLRQHYYQNFIFAAL